MCNFIERKCYFLRVFLSILIFNCVYAHDHTAIASDQQIIRLGVRADAPPMSYKTEDNRFKGYAVDVCNAIKRKYREIHHDRDVVFEWVEVNSINREEKIISGEIVSICGAFTMTIDRLKKFDFSFLIFASGASVAVKRKSPVELQLDSANLGDARVAVVSNTTTEEAVERMMGTTVIVSNFVTHDEAIQALSDNKVEYYIADRAILRSVIMQTDNPSDFNVGDGFLTYEPYALPISKDHRDFKYAANATIAELYRSGKINTIYEAHFPNQSPSDGVQGIYRIFSVPE